MEKSVTLELVIQEMSDLSMVLASNERLQYEHKKFIWAAKTFCWYASFNELIKYRAKFQEMLDVLESFKFAGRNDICFVLNGLIKVSKDSPRVFIDFGDLLDSCLYPHEEPKL